MLTTNILAFSSVITTVAAVAAVFINVYLVRKTLKAHHEQYIRDQKVKAYSEIMYAFEEVCDAELTEDSARKTDAETAMNRAIAMIDLIGPKAVYSSVTVAHEYVGRPRHDAERNAQLDNMYSEFRRDIGVVGKYLQFSVRSADPDL